MIKKDKKAFLLGEYTLKVIIAVLALVLLVYLLFSFYSSFTGEKDLAKARATMQDLQEKMLDAKNEEVSLPLLEPNGWRLISYKLGGPQECTANCICLCSKEGWFSDQVEKCDSRGICKNFQEEINEFNIKLRTDINIKYNNGYIISEK
jgi:hypothetical protein